MKGTEARVVRRNKRRKESESQALLVKMRKNLPPHLLEREEERIMMKIQTVHRNDQEAELKPHHLDCIRERNLEWLSVKRSRHLAVADLGRGHLLRSKVDERGTNLHGDLQRSKGQQRGTILLPQLDDGKMEWKRSKNTKYHAGTPEATREEVREGNGDCLHHMMSS